MFEKMLNQIDKVLNDPLASVLAVLLILLFAAYEIGLFERFESVKPPKRPKAAKLDDYTVEVEGDVHYLQSVFHRAFRAKSWEHIGTRRWRVHLYDPNAGDVTKAINDAQEGST